MQRLLISSDLHQRRGKWEDLAQAASREHPAFILIAGDILPKEGGFTRQREFFPQLGKRSILQSLEDLKAQLQPGEMARSVWIVHQPPARLGMDICGGGREVGSPALTRFIEENQPLLGCSGHIHESPHQSGGQWFAEIGGSLWIQAGQVNRRLHYVTLDITDDCAVENIRHSVFGLDHKC